MKRYNRKFLKEYDPVKMRALAGNPQRPVPRTSTNKNLPDWVIEDNLMGGDVSVEALANIVKPSKNNISIHSDDRIICYKGTVYSAPKRKSIHQYLVCWLIMNEGMKITFDEAFYWTFDNNATKVPFLCLVQNRNDSSIIYFSESYTAQLSDLVKFRDRKFKKEIQFLESKGFYIGDFIE